MQGCIACKLQRYPIQPSFRQAYSINENQIKANRLRRAFIRSFTSKLEKESFVRAKCFPSRLGDLVTIQLMCVIFQSSFITERSNTNFHIPFDSPPNANVKWKYSIKINGFVEKSPFMGNTDRRSNRSHTIAEKHSSETNKQKKQPANRMTNERMRTADRRAEGWEWVRYTER